MTYSKGTHGGVVGSGCHGELGGVEITRGREAGLDGTEPVLDALGVRWHNNSKQSTKCETSIVALRLGFIGSRLSELYKSQE